MNVLVACEESATVRNAFRVKGHNAWSCDILPTMGDPRWHYCGDAMEAIAHPGPIAGAAKWDMMIAFPPCTHLAVSGARYFAEKRADGRQQQGIDFFMAMINADIPKIAVENPVGIMSTVYRKPDQIIQPWRFGHPESKATCLWLKGLHQLQATKTMHPTVYACRCGYRFDESLGKYGCANCCADNGPARLVFDNQTPSGQNKLGPSANRAQIRSQTYQGIADAMAAQWGSL